MGPINRPLDLEWLEDFITLAKIHNFSRAAEIRAIAQPAFSRHIRSLEEWVGVELVDRSAHPVKLTAAGKEILPLLKNTVTELENARALAQAADTKSKTILFFAVTHGLSLYYFPQWLIACEDMLEFNTIKTMTDSFGVCEEMMVQGKVQFTICYGSDVVENRLDKANFPMKTLDTEILIPVCHPNLLDTTDKALSLPLLVYSADSILAKIMGVHLQKFLHKKKIKDSDFSQEPIFSSHNSLLIKALVLKGKGVAWLPKRLVSDEIKEGRLIEYQPGKLLIPIDIRLYRQSFKMPALAEKLWLNIDH